MNTPDKLTVAGIMSGTSLDGLDIAACTFEHEGDRWHFNMLETRCFTFPPHLSESLKTAHLLDSRSLFLLENQFSSFVANCVKQMHTRVSLLACHGHTLFHQPEAGLTVQLGNGALIAATTGIDTVCDFRRQDVSIGGQGAPLVPLGDALLFAEYDACLNLGGICNISMLKNGKRLAFDITFCNLVLNHLARRVGAPYDDMGKISAEGQIIPELLHQMNTLNFVQAIPPRSTGREWVEEQVLPLFMHQYDPKDLLHTAVEHIAQQVAHHAKGIKVLVTGGGTYNNTLIHRMKHHGILPVVPSNELIDFKEALIFAFLGFLRAEGKKNTLSEVTGSHGNLCSGALYKGT